MLNILLLASIVFLPILVWIFIFWHNRKKSNRYLLVSFFAGMLSIVPLKIYQKYWEESIYWLEHINVFEHLESFLHVPDLSLFFAYIISSVASAVIIFVLSWVIMIVFELFTHDNSFKVFQRKTRKILETPLIFISVGVFIGVLGFIFAESRESILWKFMLVGVLEEFAKHLLMRFSDDEKIKSISDSILFSITVALGFAFVENILYIQTIGETFLTQDWTWGLGFFVLRSFLPVLGHVCFSAIMGYFYGVAYFSRQIYQIEEYQNKHPIIKKIHKIFHVKGSSIFHEEKLFEGLFLSMMAHGLFNFLLGKNQGVLAIIYVLVLYQIILYYWNKKYSQIIRKPQINTLCFTTKTLENA